jgi:hypothetical protein
MFPDTGFNLLHEHGNALACGLEDNVAAIDVGRHVLEAKFLEARFQILHADDGMATDVDSA